MKSASTRAPFFLLLVSSALTGAQGSVYFGPKPYPNGGNEQNMGPAAQCLDQQYLIDNQYVSSAKVDAEYPCLRDYCASLTTPDECNTEENFDLGCGWCGGGCTAFISFQDAFIDCVREAYQDYDPGQVNGVTPPLTPSNTTFDHIYADFPVGLPDQGNVTNLGNKRWLSSEVGRPAGERVPIHLHPFSGLSCITSEGGTTINLEGQESFHLPDGACYSMPPMTKMVPYSANPDDPPAYIAHDTFQYEACYPIWVVLEPDSYSIQDGQFEFVSSIQCNRRGLRGQNK